MIRALSPAFDDIVYERMKITIYYRYWNLYLEISLMPEIWRMISYGHWIFHLINIIYEIGATICYDHWNLYLVKSSTREENRFIIDIGASILWYYQKIGRYDLVRALNSISRDQIRARGHDLIRRLRSVSCGIIYEKRDMIYHRHLESISKNLAYEIIEERFLIDIEFCALWSNIWDRRNDLLWILDSVSWDIIHEIRAAICYGYSILYLQISNTNQEVRFLPDIEFCIWWFHSWRQEARFLLGGSGIGFCILWYFIYEI